MVDDGAEELEFVELFGFEFVGTLRFIEVLRLELSERFGFELAELIYTRVSMIDRLETTE